VTVVENAKIGWPSGMKKTKQRASVFSILERSAKPLTALEICGKMDVDGDAVAWPSTVYRVLELFVKKGVAIKTNIMGGDMAVYELNRAGHKHYAVCMSCRKIIDMNNCPMESFIPKLADDDFHIMGHNLEIYGFCKNCKPI
jgi:Fur family ferric uptake transcriptional regulator